MKTIVLEQNTPEWLEFRRSKIGASDANIIMGMSKNITTQQLINQKAHGVEIDTSKLEFIFAKGHRLEAKVRPLTELHFDDDIQPVMVVSDEYPFLSASLDGWFEKQKCVWEHKFVGQADYEAVKNGRVLTKYIPQLQQQMMLTGAEYAILTVTTDDKTNENFPLKYCHLKVMADPDYMENKLLPKLYDFWEQVTTSKGAVATEKDIRDMSNNDRLIELLSMYEMEKDLVDKSVKNMETLKAEIFEITQLGRVECNGTKVTWSQGEDKNVPDYKKYLAKKYKASDEFIISQGYTKTTKGRKTQKITFSNPL